MFPGRHRLAGPGAAFPPCLPLSVPSLGLSVALTLSQTAAGLVTRKEAAEVVRRGDVLGRESMIIMIPEMENYLIKEGSFFVDMFQNVIFKLSK